jgi:hypothetical protein
MFIAGLAMFFLSSNYNDLLGGSMPFSFKWLGLIYFIFGALYFYPLVSLWKYTSNLSNAFSRNDENALAESFRWFRNHLRYIGIMCCFFIVLYFVLIAFLVNNAGALGRF